MDINSVTLVGRIAKDAKLTPRTVDPVSGEEKSKARCSFTLMVNKFWANNDSAAKADALPCTIFGARAEKLAQWLKTGKTVGVQGRISRYDIGAKTPDGRSVHAMAINVERVSLGQDSQKVRTGSIVNQNNAALQAVLKALCEKNGLNYTDFIAPSAQPAPAPATAAIKPSGDGDGVQVSKSQSGRKKLPKNTQANETALPFGDGDGVQG